MVALSRYYYIFTLVTLLRRKKTKQNKTKQNKKKNSLRVQSLRIDTVTANVITTSTFVLQWSWMSLLLLFFIFLIFIYLFIYYEYAGKSKQTTVLLVARRTCLRWRISRIQSTLRTEEFWHTATWFCIHTWLLKQHQYSPWENTTLAVRWWELQVATKISFWKHKQSTVMNQST